MAIIAILAAILFPVFIAARGAAYQMVVVNNIRQLSEASLMYASESDETFMPATGYDGQGFWAWFGRIRPDQTTDEAASLLRPFLGTKKMVDPIFKGKNYLGDHSGFGYNWGYIGSDMSLSNHREEYPFCWYPAHTSDLAQPSNTVVFATSSFYSARWDGGDGQDYDFGFIDPVGIRQNNPNVAFRHMSAKRIEANRVVNTGNAIVAMADGRAKAVSVKALKDEWFYRDPQILTPAP